MSALLLGGTAEARDLAARLVAADVEVVSSLAGDVAAPLLPAGKVRIGGFGGVHGLAGYLRANAVSAVVDATHPFAATMTAHAAAACAVTGVALLRLERPSWAARPDAEHWSATEYACHVRDVFRLFDTRLGLMLDQDDPLFANWDQDVTAVEDGYATQDPATVAAELLAAGDVIAASFDGVTDEQRSRVGRRSDGAVFTVDSFARYFLHDPVHHVWDVEQGYARLA